MPNSAFEIEVKEPYKQCEITNGHRIRKQIRKFGQRHFDADWNGIDVRFDLVPQPTSTGDKRWIVVRYEDEVKINTRYYQSIKEVSELIASFQSNSSEVAKGESYGYG